MTQNEIELALETILLVLEDLKKTQEEQQATITVIKEQLAEHAMREVQRLGQEIDPIAGKWDGEEIGWAEFRKRSDDYFAKYGVHIPLPSPQRTKQEPVAGHIGWLVRNSQGKLDLLTELQIDSSLEKYELLHKLYTTPPQRTWVDLTDEEIDNINYTSAHMLARKVLDKFKEKNT